MSNRLFGRAFVLAALATAAAGFSGSANAGIVASFSSLGDPTVLPAGSSLATVTPSANFASLPLGLDNGGAVYNTGGGTTMGLTNTSSYVAAPWTNTGGYTGNFFADNNGDMSTWTFATGQHSFYIYIGSLDAGNSFTITASDNTYTFTGNQWLTIPGVTLPGDGNPTIMGSTSNGWFKFTDSTGTISSITTSEVGTDVGNSFEIAAIATSTAGVPEPATWAMMIVGFLGLGFAGYGRSVRTRIA